LCTRRQRLSLEGDGAERKRATMDHYAKTEFFPALEKAIRLVDGIYTPTLYTQSSIPAHTWEMFLRALETALGPEWAVAPVVTGTADRASAQRAGRAVPITFKHPHEKKDGQEVIRLIFDEVTIQ